MNRLKVMVTGATGYIARATLQALRAAGHEVIGTTRGSPTTPDLLRIDDVGPNTDWNQALRGVTAVVHLAARVHVQHETASDPLHEFRRVNREGTAALLTAAQVGGVQTFVFVSTIGAAVDHSELPVTESTPCRPVGPYAISKFEAEQIVVRQASSMRVVVIRPPMVYGRDAPGNFSPLVAAIRRGLPLPIGSVRNRRSFLFVENLADALRCAVVNPRARGLYHVADDLGISTAEFARMIGLAVGRPARLISVPEPILRAAGSLAGQRKRLEKLIQSLPVDSTRFRNDVGWTPPFATADALRASFQR